MNIYFGFTVAGDRSSIATAKEVVELLERMGHVVLTRHLMQDDAWEADRRITPQQVYQRDMRWLAACGCLMKKGQRQRSQALLRRSCADGES